MSSCPTAPASTTASSSSCRSPADPPVLVIACGALGAHLREIIARRGWRAEVRCLPALLHNRPQRISSYAERLARAALARGQRVAVAYADCGTYGALDEVCTRLGLRRLPGLHCYDVLAGPARMRAMFAADPGTYVLTDFGVRSFRRTVLAELGLDRHPELWPDYFGHYRRLVWLAQEREGGLEAQARAVAARFGLPLTVVETGTARLERELEALLALDDAGEPGAGSEPVIQGEPGRLSSLPQRRHKNVGAATTTPNEASPAVIRGRP
jgi:Protein of unknown function (DUF1638)